MGLGTWDLGSHVDWTLNIVFSITYYLELYNVVILYCISHFMPTKVELVVWTL